MVHLQTMFSNAKISPTAVRELLLVVFACKECLLKK